MPDIPFGLDVTPSGATPGGAGSAPSSGGALATFIGRGVTSPFRRASSDLANAEGIALLKNNMKQILGVRADSDYTTGELPWRTEFGSLLHLLRHKPNTLATEELARIYVVEALARWEPRILVRAVGITREVGPDANLQERPVLLVRITFDVRSVNTPSSLVAEGETLDIAA